jgi:membrane fusion protein, copper/silver efflux system
MFIYKTIRSFLFIIILPVVFLFSCSSEKTKGISIKEDGAAIKLSESQIHLANIKSSKVTEGVIGHQLMFTGVLKVDEQSSVTVSSRASGRIEKLFFKNTGEKINAGDALFEFYSEELWNAEREFIGLQQYNRNLSGRYEPSLVAENKLLLLGLLPSQIEQLRKENKILYVITVYSTVSGIIKSVNITEGQYVSKGQSLFELADDNKLWAEAQVYPNDLQYLNVGMPADVIIPIAGDLRIHNLISYINPVFEPGKNITLIRAVIDNPGKKLYPGMLAVISVRTQLSRGIIVPSEAVLNDKKGSKVLVQLEDGSFAARKVITGTQSTDSVQILNGLKPSDMVVTSGVYLLNSEMILNNTTESLE